MEVQDAIAGWAARAHYPVEIIHGMQQVSAAGAGCEESAIPKNQTLDRVRSRRASWHEVISIRRVSDEPVASNTRKASEPVGYSTDVQYAGETYGCTGGGTPGHPIGAVLQGSLHT